MPKIEAGSPGLGARLSRYFPDHEIYVRSGGQMRFLRISTSLQMKAAAAAALALLAWLAMTAATFGMQYQTMRERAALTQSAGRVEAYRDSVDGIAARLEQRQRRMNAVVERYFGRMPATAAPVETSAIIPEVAPLAAIEQRQFAFAETLTEAASRRSAEAERALRAAGLDPRRVATRAVGGPFVPAGETDGRFVRLAQSLKRLDAMERTLRAIPSAAPAFPMAVTSGFGVRNDPFLGGAALHAGVDVSGRHGQPIHAAAPGRVVQVGYSGGYGMLVTIDHGHGFETRYGHLSGAAVKPGDRVARGQRIAAMGNTGRSTGTHLHFEVRQGGRAVNPRRFLGGNRHVLEAQGRIERRLGRPGA